VIFSLEGFISELIEYAEKNRVKLITMADISEQILLAGTDGDKISWWRLLTNKFVS
jgi:hypothetical protein